MKTAALLKKAIAMCLTVLIAAGVCQMPVMAANYTASYASYKAPSNTADCAYWSGSKIVRSSGTTVSEVKWMQAALNACINYKLIKVSKLDVDGSFGPATKSATLAFQKAYNLTQDGKFGPKTIQQMKVVLDGLGKTTKVTKSGLNNLTTTQGSGVHLAGKFSSTGSKIFSVTASVANTNLRKTECNINSNTYSLKNSVIDNALAFGTLKAGTYTITYTVKTTNGTSKTFTNKITVKNTAAAESKNSTSTPPASGSKFSKMKAYTGNNYKNYYVVKGYSNAYRFNQYNYSRFIINGKNQGCTATSVCMVLSMAKGKTVSPSTYPWSKSGCAWQYCDYITSASNASEKLRQVAEQLLKGRAIALWANNRHMVAVIGLKSSANLKSLKASDFLIVDPAGGHITTLNNAGGGGYYYTNYRMYYATGY